MKNKPIKSDVVIEAVMAKNHSALAKIISKGTYDLNKQDDAGHTPLANALYLKDFKAAHMLIEAGADVCTIDLIGFTPLHLTIKMCEDYLKAGYSKEEIFDLITKLASSMTCGHQDRRGNTPISMIAQRAKTGKTTAKIYAEMCRLLLALDQNASDTVQLRNNMGKGPLDYLTKNGNYMLSDVIRDRLPQVQNKMEAEMLGKAMEAQKLAALGQEVVG